MKKIFAIVLCVCLALTVSVSVMAASSPQNNVIVIKGEGTDESGAAIKEDTYVTVSENGVITVTSSSKYGKFDSWSIYVVEETVDPTTGVAKKVTRLAKLNEDFVIVTGDLKSDTIKIKPISSGVKIAVAGNYGNTITDPLKTSDAAGTPAKSDKTGDASAMLLVVSLLSGAAVLFGAKRQFSK